MDDPVAKLFKNRVAIRAVADVLALITALPNKRETPLPEDPKGRFQFWFDGGACEVITGCTEYRLRDGTMVREAVTPNLSVSIKFADGREVEIRQRPQK